MTTQKELQGLVDRLNTATGNALAPWRKADDGKLHANIGNYHLDYAYGGVRLVQTMNDGGGIRTVVAGYDTKTECYKQIAAYLRGIEDCILSETDFNKSLKIIIKERA